MVDLYKLFVGGEQKVLSHAKVGDYGTNGDHSNSVQSVQPYLSRPELKKID